MYTRINRYWKDYFGATWNAVNDFVPRFGAIMLDLEQGEYKIDNFAVHALGLTMNSTFEEVKAIVEKYTNESSSKVKLKSVFSSGIMYVGVVYCDDDIKFTGNDLDLGITGHDREETLLSAVLDEEKFYYVFQPIVNAHSGAVEAYEALLRTNPEIGLSPLDVLDLAEKYDRMYDIERITFSSTLDFLARNQISFINKKLYINSIPAHMLSDEDWDRMVDSYGELMEKLVIEMTESTELTDEALATITNRLRDRHISSAIDDYGTGYSNTSNLLRYDPNVVKIDRSLIAGIDTNHKMQKLVTSVVEALHTSGFMALAEGIETRGELEFMINVGADLLQGYYLAKPKQILLENISDIVCDEIKAINQELSNEVVRVYRPKENDKVHLSYLVENRYTLLLIDTENVTIIGDINTKPASLTISVKDNTNCVINIVDTKLSSSTQEPTLLLGNNCTVILNCEGDNFFDRKGILVPSSSSLKIVGEGNLDIKSEMKDCFGIGTDSKHHHGNIEINIGGRLNVVANGDHFIGIGGGSREGSNRIRIIGGEVSLVGTGASGVGLGTVNGNADIEIKNCEISFDVQSSDTIQVGCERGAVKLNIQNVYYKGIGSGKHQSGIGALSVGEGDIYIANSLIDMSMKGEQLIYIGTYAGNMNAKLINSKLVFFGEGANIVGVGDSEGAGNYYMENLELDSNFTSANLLEYGCKLGTFKKVNC